jgi:nicotinamidase-related amidase
MVLAGQAGGQERLELRLQFQSESPPRSGKFTVQTREESWQAAETAIIVCDVWDYHHCRNAVLRMEQFLPRLDAVLADARRRGVTIIHAPSDCMDAYRDHPARRRAIETPKSASLPDDIESWCSSIPAEEHAVFPIDQSDGGEDDDPAEHAEWAARLASLGRNPQMPWKKQSDAITIDDQLDYISERGDEVWSILTARGIGNVILTGVHTNMCVLGRPFGLRQLARNGKNVVLMRDLTDTMYNPQRWPFVSHFEGTRRVILHIERFVCPTISSDQLIGGQPFRFAGDNGEVESSEPPPDPVSHWVPVAVPADDQHPPTAAASNWYRCVVRLPKDWLDQSLRLKVHDAAAARAWINGKALTSQPRGSRVNAFSIPRDVLEPGDANLLVLELPGGRLLRAPVIDAGSKQAAAGRLVLAGRWQLRIGGDASFASMPLPARFGGSPEIVFDAIGKRP